MTPRVATDSGTSLGVKLLTAGTAACFADITTFPLDTAKVRLQVQGEGQLRLPTLNSNGTLNVQVRTQPLYRGMVGTIATIYKQEGFRALYNGLSAGLQRQMCFASVRLGLYDTVKEFYQTIINENPNSLHIFTRTLAGITTGGMAVIFAQPTDVVKVRFQAQKMPAPGETKKYKTTIAAYRMIFREEGMKGLWRGSFPNIGRNAIVNVTEIVCYDIVKDCLMEYANMKNDIKCHFSSAVVSGFITTLFASPVDVVKTRYMNSTAGTYKGAIHCGVKMATLEGPSAFFKGFMPSFARMVSWNIVLWITYEQLKRVTFRSTTSDK